MKKLKEEIHELGVLMATIKDKYFGIPYDEEYATDINKIIDNANKLNCKILTTEKDFIRIDHPNKIKFKFLKSELKIIDEEKLIKYLL